MFSKLMVTFASALSVCASPIVLRQTAGPPATGTVGYVGVTAPGVPYSAGTVSSDGQFAGYGTVSRDWVWTNVPGGLTLSTSTGQCGLVNNALVCGRGTPATVFAFSGDSDFATFGISGQGWDISGDGTTIVVVPLDQSTLSLTFSQNESD